MKILVCDDDPLTVDALATCFEREGYEVVRAKNGAEAVEVWEAESPDLICLDIMMPVCDGYEACRKIRKTDIITPILFLSAKNEERDLVAGLNMGADDYMTKPFSIREFIARVKAIFRRTAIIKENLEAQQKDSVLKRGDLVIDMDKRKVSTHGKRIELSPKEFELLTLLASKPGKSYDRSKLLNLVWGYDFDGFEHTVNSHINRLRGKIEPNIQKPIYILTTWGVGYRFSEDV